MKKFNKVISVEVSVDAIAQQLLKSFDPQFPHREMLTETIIGMNLNNGSLGLIYNNLAGYSNDPDFKVGQEVWTPETQYHGDTREVIGNCKIVAIDGTKTSSKIEVEYDYIYKSKRNDTVIQEPRTGKSWVSHLTLEEPKVATPTKTKY